MSANPREIAYRRYSAWIGNGCAWIGTALGVFALYVVLFGYRDALRLPDIPRPNVGPGFSERVTAIIGAFWVGGWISLIALVAVAIALLHRKRKLRTLIFALPALLCLVLVATQPRWAFG